VITVEEATIVTDELVEAMSRLVPQLSRSSPPPDVDMLRRIVESESSVLLLAFDDEVIVGSLTLVVFTIPTGLRARIEDVVVDETVRGKGVGATLSAAALARAVAEGARTVDLTSRPAREAAVRLYERLGFEARDTNVYRFEL
jgi:ribosomal protein S18 acetylase RimI-like enzyme